MSLCNKTAPLFLSPLLLRRRHHVAHLQTRGGLISVALSFPSLIIPITTEGINAALVDTKSLVKRAVYSLLFHKVMVAE